MLGGPPTGFGPASERHPSLARPTPAVVSIGGFVRDDGIARGYRGSPRKPRDGLRFGRLPRSQTGLPSPTTAFVTHDQDFYLPACVYLLLDWTKDQFATVVQLCSCLTSSTTCLRTGGAGFLGRPGLPGVPSPKTPYPPRLVAPCQYQHPLWRRLLDLAPEPSSCHANRFVARAHASISCHVHAGAPLTVQRGCGRSSRLRHMWGVSGSTPSLPAISRSPTGSHPMAKKCSRFLGFLSRSYGHLSRDVVHSR